MREGDPRGRRLAIVSHELMNAHLADDSDAADTLARIEALGYGLMSLPPVTQPESLQAAALNQLVDQLQDYIRHGYAAIAVEDRSTNGLLERLDAHCRRREIALPQRVRAGADFRLALEGSDDAQR
jgi:hypothetical protein